MFVPNPVPVIDILDFNTGDADFGDIDINDAENVGLV